MKIINSASFIVNVIIAFSIGTITYGEIMNQRNADALEDFMEQKQCIAMNIYHEARGDSKLGMKAVAFVTLNRVQSEQYPDTPCDVVYQARLDGNGNPKRNQCQFSWFCDGRSDDPKDKVLFQLADSLAYEVMAEYGEVEDPTDGAIMYHASYVKPYWAKEYEKTVRIDTHIFYK